jgi:ribose transport system permease protein
MFIGLINGLIVTKGKVNSFIATLGMSLMLDGFVLIFLKNSSLLGINKEYVYISDGKLFFINFPIWLLIIALIISYLILKRSILGRRFYAIGGNDYICKVFGINTDFYKIIAFIICGMLSSFSGIILSSHLNMISPDFGKTTMLIVISAVVFGGTSLKGGEGGIVNSYISVLIFTILANGFGLLGIGMYYQQYIWGFAIIAVLTIDKYKHKVEYKI